MNIVKGSVVTAKAGRDKGNFFIVTGILENGYVLICDGKRRKVEHPKAKNIIHLQATNIVATNFSTNREIKKYLKTFMEGEHV